MVILFHFKTTSLKWAISAIQQSHSLSLVGSFSHLLRLLYYISSLLQHLPPSHSKLITLLLVSEKQNLSKENFLILSTWVCFFCVFVLFLFFYSTCTYTYILCLPTCYYGYFLLLLKPIFYLYTGFHSCCFCTIKSFPLY